LDAQEVKMANKIIVRAPGNVHIRIARRESADRATHEVLTSGEKERFVKFFELHITRIITAKYGEKAWWFWFPGYGWRDLLPLTGKAYLTIRRQPDDCEEFEVLVRWGDQTSLIIQEKGDI
jgi:hypothetical protein